MLPKRERLSRHAINELLKKGRRYPGALFDIRHLPSPTFQAAVVVSKKVSPLSVGRHLLKRRVVSALRTHKSDIGATAVLCILKKTTELPTTKDYGSALNEFTRKGIAKSV